MAGINIPKRFESTVNKVVAAANKQGASISTPKQIIIKKTQPKRTAAEQIKQNRIDARPVNMMIDTNTGASTTTPLEPTLTTTTDLTTIDPLAFAGSMLFGLPGVIAGAIMGETEGQPESTTTTITGLDQIPTETITEIIPLITPDFNPPPSAGGSLPSLPGLPNFNLSGIAPIALLGGAALLAFMLLKK